MCCSKKKKEGKRKKKKGGEKMERKKSGKNCCHVYAHRCNGAIVNSALCYKQRACDGLIYFLSMQVRRAPGVNYGDVERSLKDRMIIINIARKVARCKDIKFHAGKTTNSNTAYTSFRGNSKFK